MTCEVLDVPSLEQLGFGGVLGAGRGGEDPPCVVVLRYQPTGKRPIGLVGKGVTFDSGGYHVKSLDEMVLMKADMAGAAAAMGALRAAALCGLEQDLVVILPFVENLVGRHAYRPGDVITHYGGKTCEVVDPDNEGRLVLADGLAYAMELNPAAVVDIGTLTDGSGLGRDLWALFANDRKLAGALLEAGKTAGEPGWELPLWRSYRSQLCSSVADVANANRTADSATLAALFLDHFVEGVPWAHIDLGDAALRATDHDERATGVGVRTLWHLIRGWTGAAKLEER